VGIAIIGIFASFKTSIHMKNELEEISQRSVWPPDG
jgi:hypothetical protein